MVIRNTLICSTCANRITVRCQVGRIDPVIIRIACDQCSKVIKGYFTVKDDAAFVFPNDQCIVEREDTKQNVPVCKLSGVNSICVSSNNLSVVPQLQDSASPDLTVSTYPLT
jgi:hypothetical protein